MLIQLLELMAERTRWFIGFAQTRFLGAVAILGAASAVSLISTMGLSMYAARVLGVDEFGKFSIALAISYLILSFVEFGLAPTVTREISINPARLEIHLSSACLLKAIISGLSLVVVAFLNYPMDIKIAIWGMSFYSIILSFVNLFSSVFQAYERFNWMAAIKMEGVIKLVLGILILSGVKTVSGVVLAWVIAALLTILLCLLIYRWGIGPMHFHIDWENVKYVFIESSYLAIAYILWMAATRQGTFILSLLKGVKEVAIYEAANQWVGLVSTSVYALFAAVMFPKLAKLYVISKKQSQRLFERILVLVLLLGLMMAVVISLFSEQIILLSVGPKFLNAANVLRILIWGMLFFNTIGLIGVALNATGHQKMSLVIVTPPIIIGGILGLVITPHYSYVGMAVAMTLSWMITAVWGLFILYTKVFNINFC